MLTVRRVVGHICSQRIVDNIASELQLKAWVTWGFCSRLALQSAINLSMVSINLYAILKHRTLSEECWLLPWHGKTVPQNVAIPSVLFLTLY